MGFAYISALRVNSSNKPVIGQTKGQQVVFAQAGVVGSAADGVAPVPPERRSVGEGWAAAGTKVVFALPLAAGCLSCGFSPYCVLLAVFG